jgi:hypothetical protein
MKTERNRAVEYIDESYEWPSDKVRDIAVRAEDRLIYLLTEINNRTAAVLKMHGNGGNDSWTAIAGQTGGFGFDCQMAAQAAEVAHLAQTFVDIAHTVTMKNQEA